MSVADIRSAHDLNALGLLRCRIISGEPAVIWKTTQPESAREFSQLDVGKERVLFTQRVRK